MNILVSTISYVNSSKQGTEIYTTFAKRLANDVLTKTNFDVFINTNRKDLFEEINNNPRVTIRDQFLKDHYTHVGAFNQLLKFSAIKEIDSKYDWVIYLDCDAGFTDKLDIEAIENYLLQLDKENIDMVAMRTNATYEECLKDFNESTDFGKDLSYSIHPKKLFNDKYVFYGIKPEWVGAKLPSEHVFVIKNNSKLQLMAEEFEKFCYKFETQDKQYPVTFDMEAFEIGVSAFLSGYNLQELGWGNHTDLFKVGFNFNNFEKVKL